MNPIAARLVVDLTRDYARSALPDAPKVPDPPDPPAPVFRRRMAQALRWAANRLEPGAASQASMT
ncbi:MAG: hypothetical protein AUG44_04430 [Actinobacteria bacterium 13_1_20CM_3_71_11]|nr:MAG: hypothetical protein AUG44_04430 [Actinobacteria bacterium 13_1_20CM_3_71_11]